MIERILLRNWRGYEKLSLDVGPGLTFVIADNGVGKTSLVNGVAWAIFGDAAGVDADAAIRTGTEEATVEVDLGLGDTRFSVARSLRRSGRRRQTVQATVDGEEVTPAEWRRRLGTAAAVPFDILPQLVLVPEMRLTHEGELFADVQGHLSGLLGIDHLRRAAARAREVQARAARDIRAARALARVDQATVDAARSHRDTVAAEVGEVDAALADHRERRAELDAALSRLDAWSAYDEGLARYRRRLDELGAEARSLGLDAAVTAIAAVGEGDTRGLDQVYEAEDEVRHSVDELRGDAAAAQAERQVVQGLIDQLDAVEAVCPVCLQSVDGDVASHASEAHRARLAEIERRQAEVEERHREVAAAAKQVTGLVSRLARLDPPSPPDVGRPDDDPDAVRAAIRGMDTAIEDLLHRRGALAQQEEQAQRAVEEAESARTAAAELTRMHALGAAAEALAELATAEADARTERSLDPLSQTLAQRWSEFFVGSSARPRLAGGGSIELGHTAATIPYASFSGGEKTLASLLTRLLFVTAATRLDAMWLDEPLEHLDPANRTKVARLLAQVTQGSSHLRQVLVTTYEEGLARTMIERHDAASIVYVSTDDLV